MISLGAVIVLILVSLVVCGLVFAFGIIVGREMN
jgi:hypothetical protein